MIISASLFITMMMPLSKTEAEPFGA